MPRFFLYFLVFKEYMKSFFFLKYNGIFFFHIIFCLRGSLENKEKKKNLLYSMQKLYFKEKQKKFSDLKKETLGGSFTRKTL